MEQEILHPALQHSTTVSWINGIKEIKEAADYIAASCEEDGIWDAFQHFQLI